MPKGRKKAPQESVDSILLAISRRDDLDEDTMSHYIDRLDEEWTNGARDKVLRLLRSHDQTAHIAAVNILSELATDFDLEEIEDTVTDPTVSDLAKLSLAPVLKDLNSEMADEGLLEYLNDPEAAMQQMQLRLLEMMGKSEPGIEEMLEDVQNMPIEKRLSFVNWLGSSYDPRAANMLIPMLENQQTGVIEATIDALEQLGSLAAQQTIPALDYLVTHTSNRAIKQKARAALGRLTMQSPPGMAEAALAGAYQPELTFHQGLVSFIDGTGVQMLFLSWRRPDGLIKGINLLIQDTLGIKDGMALDELSTEHWEALVAKAPQEGITCFEVSLHDARALIGEMRAINKRTRQRLPVTYIIWRPLIEGNEMVKPGKQVTPPSMLLNSLELTPDILHLAERGNALYDLAEFVSWMYEPIEHLYPFIEMYWSKQPTHPKPHRGRSLHKLQQSHSDMEEAVTRAIEALITDEWRELYTTRLLRQAALLQMAQRPEDALLAQAVASALREPTNVPLTEQAFVRAMMRYSIEQGPLRLLSDVLESGRLGPLPEGLFP